MSALFNVGDRVKVIASREDLASEGISAVISEEIGTVVSGGNDHHVRVRIKLDGLLNRDWLLEDCLLELVERAPKFKLGDRVRVKPTLTASDLGQISISAPPEKIIGHEGVVDQLDPNEPLSVRVVLDRQNADVDKVWWFEWWMVEPVATIKPTTVDPDSWLKKQATF